MCQCAFVYMHAFILLCSAFFPFLSFPYNYAFSSQTLTRERTHTNAHALCYECMQFGCEWQTCIGKSYFDRIASKQEIATVVALTYSKKRRNKQNALAQTTISGSTRRPRPPPPSTPPLLTPPRTDLKRTDPQEEGARWGVHGIPRVMTLVLLLLLFAHPLPFLNSIIR